ncbi:hypothetical protein Q4543_15200 [Salipiger sp. 1_MG-2023]|uniref:hypothetical protein n=1 Tax=Salipiger sp. 1_MG-2023 TaxID=3062665 RepID=UPI0026E25A8B|nr:hypothetical protein [Salipiger sp. 1_MG-2023]MDO6586859.1 hypothetical protein [Salipiger sp. 1_MG-2023]
MDNMIVRHALRASIVSVFGCPKMLTSTKTRFKMNEQPEIEDGSEQRAFLVLFPQNSDITDLSAFGLPPEGEPGTALRDISEQLLAVLQAVWHDLSPLEYGCFATPEVQALLPRAAEAMAGKACPRLLDDARLCRTLPFWTEAAAMAGLQLHCTLAIAAPLQAAQPLTEASDIDALKVRLLWLRHVLDVECDSRGLPRRWVDLDALAEREPLQAVSSDQLAQPHGWVRETLNILQRWSEAGEDSADHPRLDDIRAGFDAATSLFGSILGRAESAAREQAALRRELEEARARGRLGAIAAQVDAKTMAAEQEQAALRKTLVELRAQLDTRNTELEDMRERARDERADLESQLESARQDSARLEALVHDLTSTLAQRQAELDDTQAELEAAPDAAVVEALEGRLAETLLEQTRLKTDNERRDAELAVLARQLLEQGEALSVKERELGAARAAHEILRAEGAELSCKLETTRRERDEATGRSMVQDRELAELGKVLVAQQTETEEMIRARDAATATAATEADRATKAETESESLRGRLAERNAALRSTREELVTAWSMLHPGAPKPQSETVPALAGQLKDLLETLDRRARDGEQGAEALQQELEQLRTQMQEIETHRSALLRSTSWRLTGPLRWVVEHLRPGS